MAKFNLETIGINGGAREHRVAASATVVSVGEPLMTTPTYSSGASDANTVIALTDAKPTIGTDDFIGLCTKDFEVDSAGTVIAHKTFATAIIPHVTLIRGKAKVKANIDTDAELLLILRDLVLFDLTGTTYTIDETAAANTAGLQIVQGNITKGTLDVSVDARALRKSVS